MVAPRLDIALLLTLLDDDDPDDFDPEAATVPVEDDEHDWAVPQRLAA